MPDKTCIPFTEDQFHMLRRCILSRVVYLTRELEYYADTDSTFRVFEELIALSNWGIELELNGYFPVDSSFGDFNGKR